MKLETILEKTKNRQNLTEREPVHIAEDDRPYENIIPISSSEQRINKKVIEKLETNLRQSGDKLATQPTKNLLQTDSKSTSETTSNLLQTDFKLTSETTSKLLQTDFKSTSETTSNKTEQNKTTSETTSIRLQTDFKLTSNRSICELSGMQYKVMIFIYEECKKAKEKWTNPLTLNYIENKTNINKKTLKTCFYRLEKRGYLARKGHKSGRGGWTKYELSTDVYHELLQAESNEKLTSKLLQTDFKLTSEATSQTTSTSPSSSSSNNITTTTRLPENWSNINLSHSEQFGFNQSHVVQLYNSKNVEPKMLEDSIRYFLYDLEYNDKAKEIKTNPLSFFMAILRRTGMYSAPENYESPEEKAMKQYLHAKKATQEREEALEKECFAVEFTSWLNEQSEEDKEALLSEEVKKTGLNAARTAELKKHFEKTCWTQRRKKIQIMLDSV